MPTTLMTPAEFSASLTRDSLVEARWTNTGHRYVAQARVVKVNAKSVQVELSASVREDDGILIYSLLHCVTLPRYASAGYSANNGAYPVVEEAEVDMLPSTISDEMRQALLADHATIQEMLTDVDIDATTEAVLAADAPVPLVLDLADARKTDSDLGLSFPEEPRVTSEQECAEDRYEWLNDDPAVPCPAPCVWLYTTAPSNLDFAGTVGQEVIGMLLSKDGLQPSDTYRKVQCHLEQEQAQAAAYGSGGWNTHTPAEFGTLLDEAWFQMRFVPRGCTVADQEPFEGISVLRKDYALWRTYRQQLVDPAPAPRFNREDVTWLESLDAMLMPDAAEDALDTETLYPGPLREHEATFGTGPVAEILALVAQGTEAIAAALANGQLRWGKEERKVKKQPGAMHESSGIIPAVLRLDATGRLGKLNHEALLASYEGRAFAPGSFATRRVLRAHDYLTDDDALTAKGLTYCEQFRPSVATPAS